MDCVCPKNVTSSYTARSWDKFIVLEVCKLETFIQAAFPFNGCWHRGAVLTSAPNVILLLLTLLGAAAVVEASVIGGLVVLLVVLLLLLAADEPISALRTAMTLLLRSNRAPLL